jgi:predicted aspartyl protease
MRWGLIGLPPLVVGCFLTIAVNFSSVSAQGQKPDYLWEGWHKVPDPSHIQYKVFHDKVVALSNLYGSDERGTGCSPFPFAGRIAKVNFDDQGLKAQNFILETDDGDRSLINVLPISITDPGMNMADLGWIVQGLQILLHPNWYIQGDAFACGSGGFLYLNKIASASSTKRISTPPNTIALVPEPDRNASIAPQSPAQTTSNDVESIPLLVQGGTFVIPVLINAQITLNFTIDSGAADVSIPADVVSTLMRTGTLQESDFVGQKTYRLADGSTVPSVTFSIRSLKVGKHLLENVTGSVASARADLLLGQSFLSRFSSWSIDNKRRVLLLN